MEGNRTKKKEPGGTGPYNVRTIEGRDYADHIPRTENRI